jgi:hypothetical protein
VKLVRKARLARRLASEKPKFAERQKNLLAERYDLADRPAAGVTMSRGKAVQDGVRVKLRTMRRAISRTSSARRLRLALESLSWACLSAIR